MGNSISNTICETASSIAQQLHTLCCISVPEKDLQVKDKYETYTDEIVVSPKHQDNIDLKLSYHHCTSENTPTYSYENLKKLVKVLKVMDGDTIDIALHHEDTGKIFKHRVRLYGIDTPEMHPSLSDPNRAKEIEASKQAKEALTHRLLENDNLVIALFHTFDKYGRLMATLYDKQGEDINRWMITSGYAEEYFGKTKKKFVERAPLMVAECVNEYFETPRTLEQSEEKKEETIAPKEDALDILKDEDFEEFPENITEEAKNSVHIV
jgi:endonuclease YncB( thermonuclease family)